MCIGLGMASSKVFFSKLPSTPFSRTLLSFFAPFSLVNSATFCSFVVHNLYLRSYKHGILIDHTFGVFFFLVITVDIASDQN